MKHYRLEASLTGQGNAMTLEVVSIMATNDNDAMMDAIGIIMDKAYKQTNAWSIGQIYLVNEDNAVIAEMGAK